MNPTKKLTQIILDSSVIAKWFFPDENQGDVALELRAQFLSKDISIVVPVLIYYEINNLLRTAIKNLRINEQLAHEAYQGFLELDLIAYSSKELMTLTLEKAVTLDISSYDAAYVSLAEHLKIPFITADLKLLSKAKSDLVQDLGSFNF